MTKFSQVVFDITSGGASTADKLAYLLDKYAELISDEDREAFVLALAGDLLVYRAQASRNNRS